jgi:hypothetical protein
LATDAEIEAWITAALAEVMGLLARALAAAGGSAPPGSSLDQLGLLDGDRLVLDYLEHGESGVALEHLVYMAEASELPLPRSTLRLIEQAGGAMRMDPGLWDSLPVEPSA